MQSEGKVLLMLDDSLDSRMIAASLEASGLETVTVGDGIAGLSMVSESKPDIVVCSRSLPKMDGLEVCRLIKRNHKLKHVAVLIILDGDEGGEDDTAIVSSLEVGANDYLLQPLQMTELVAAVKSHLRTRTSLTRLKDDNREYAAILEIAEMLTATLNSSDLFYIIVHKVAEALGVEQCALFRIHAEEGKVFVEASMDPEDADSPEAELADHPELKRCIEAGKMTYVEDVRKDPVLSAVYGHDKQLGILTVPLQLRQARDRNVVFKMTRVGEAFTYREIKFCQIATTVAANALDNAYLFESLEIAHTQLTEVSKRDHLTAVYNRGYLFERLGEEFARSNEHEAPLACILLDVDHFKAVNDDLGHQVGDAVLIGLGRILMDCLRDEDVIGRYGGEEFLAVLPDTDAEGALLVAERIRTEVRNTDFEGVTGRNITVSLGVALCGVALRDDEAPITDLKELVGRADLALYEAKDGGRDRTVIHESAAEPQTTAKEA